MSGLRLDKLLWYLRLAKTRALAQERIEAGHIRVNGRRIERSSQTAGCGDILTIPLGNKVTVIELLAIPVRRGPAPEAQSCYRTLDADAGVAIAAGETVQATGKPGP